MASYHLTVKNHSRSKNANAVALASYRSGEKLYDERLQQYKNCRKDDKSAVLHLELFNSHRMNREQLWNAAEMAENRRNSVVATEVEIALPIDISDVQKVSLARDFCGYLSSRYNCAVDLAVHAPDTDGDQRNYHAHILMTTRQVGARGMGAKWRQLSQPNGAGRIEMNKLRKKFENLQNKYLEKSGVQERVSSGRVREMDVPKKYVALPFKKYQVMRREGRVEDYKEVSGLEEFSRWKAQKDLEIEDLAGEIEYTREMEELEEAMGTSAYYDPVGVLIDEDIQRREESKKQSIEERCRRRRRQKRRQERKEVQQNLQKERQERLRFREERQKEELEQRSEENVRNRNIEEFLPGGIEKERHENSSPGESITTGADSREVAELFDEFSRASAENSRQSAGVYNERIRKDQRDFEDISRKAEDDQRNISERAAELGQGIRSTGENTRECGDRVSETCEAIEQRAFQVRRFREQRVIGQRFMRYSGELAEGFQGLGKTAGRITAGLRRRNVKTLGGFIKGAVKAVVNKVKNVVVLSWLKMNIVPHTGKPWWEGASKIEHREKFDKIEEEMKAWQEYDYINGAARSGAERVLNSFSQYRDHLSIELLDLEKEAKKWNKTDPLLAKINEMRMELSNRSKEIIPELNRQVKEDKLELERERQLALEKAQKDRREIEARVTLSLRPTDTDKIEERKQDKGRGGRKM
jgi:hypothetical protein